MSARNLSITLSLFIFALVTLNPGSAKAGVPEPIDLRPLASAITGASGADFEKALDATLAKTKKRSRRNNRNRGGIRYKRGKTIHAAPKLSEADRIKQNTDPLAYLKGTGLSKETPLTHHWPTKKPQGGNAKGKGSKGSQKKK